MTKREVTDETMLVQLTVGELRELIRDEIAEAISEWQAPEYLSTEQVAEMIGCTVESIRTYCSRDALPCVRIGKLRRFHRADIIDWLEERRTKPRSHAGRHAQTLAKVRRSKKDQL